MSTNNHGELLIEKCLEGVVLQGHPDLVSNCHSLWQEGHVHEPNVAIPHESTEVFREVATNVLVTTNDKVS